MKLQVELLQEDIDKGGHAPCWCPMHRAITRAMEGRRIVIVYLRTVKVGSVLIELPLEANQWIMDYDYWPTRKALPMAFELEVP